MFLLSLSGTVFIFGVAGLFFLLRLKSSRSESKRVSFIGLNEQNENKEFLIKAELEITLNSLLSTFSTKSSKLYSDPQKINFFHNGKFLLVQDYNVKNMLFINKRRVKKTTLRDGDLVEVGNLKLMYLDNSSHSRFDGLRSRLKHFNHKNFKQTIPEHLPRLVAFDNRKKTTVLSKNLTYIGKSETNDIILKIKDVSFKHAVIKRISGKYKLIDLNSKSGTYINGKRFDEKFLNNGDEIAFDTAKYKIVYPEISYI